MHADTISYFLNDLKSRNSEKEEYANGGIGKNEAPVVRAKDGGNCDNCLFLFAQSSLTSQRFHVAPLGTVSHLPSDGPSDFDSYFLNDLQLLYNDRRSLERSVRKSEIVRDVPKNADTVSYFLNELYSRNNEQRNVGERSIRNSEAIRDASKNNAVRDNPKNTDTVSYFLNNLASQKKTGGEDVLSGTAAADAHTDTVSYFLNNLASQKKTSGEDVLSGTAAADALLFGGPSNLKIIGSRAEFDAAIVRGTVEYKLVVVRFYATWCKSCRAMQPLFRRLMQEHPNILFLEVPVSHARSFVTSELDVKTFPFGHVYGPGGGLVESRSIEKKNFSDFVSAIETRLKGS
eukprot:CAMPEP_0194345290 /NCGR_PEP_ID=MMETSP0171-20130528/104773_1 /TAXON_ID=218684 /ORGANISM="Corethron pennatum, Strain L29A3" /LENGTH=345 /DNA_ID=CAMNT_0039112255 /DNA_START=399 /DNA_END=1436 /DNA_ORIENTATION=+